MSEVIDVASDPGPSRPVFDVALEAQDLDCEIRVNDIPVLRAKVGRVLTAFDVNPCVMSGDNTLTLAVRPPRDGEYSAGAMAKVALRRRASPDHEEADLLAGLAFSGASANASNGFEESPGYATEEPPQVRFRGVSATQKVSFETPFTPWSWVTSPPIRVNEETRAELFAAYQRVWRLMRARDIDALVKECAYQAADYKVAYYLSSDDEANRLLGVAQTFADPDVEIDDLDDTDLEVEKIAGGRLVQLVDKEGKSPLRLRVRDNDRLTGRFVCVFARTAGGFRIAR